MISNMSARDKKILIILLAAVILILCGIAVWKPLYTGVSAAQKKNKELSVQKTTMVTEIKKLPEYKQNLEKAKKSYSETAKRVYAPMTNDMIDDIITGEFILALGLQPSSFSIKSIEKGSISNYQAAVPNAGVPAKMGELLKKDSGRSTQFANISINVKGSANVITLLDKIDKTEGMLLEQVSITKPDENSLVANISFIMLFSENFN